MYQNPRADAPSARCSSPRSGWTPGSSRQSGSWEPNDRWSIDVKSRVYATAINALTLETSYRFAQRFGADEK